MSVRLPALRADRSVLLAKIPGTDLSWGLSRFPGEVQLEGLGKMTQNPMTFRLVSQYPNQLRYRENIKHVHGPL
jgi:hypothetical protein